MNFQDLHELLRLELLRRIEHGALTGTLLAQQTGFRQAHISNFLNRKRALSLEGLDKMLAAQKLSIDQILPMELAASTVHPKTLGNAHKSEGKSPGETAPLDQSETVPVVTASAAVDEAHIKPASIIETIQVPVSRLSDSRERVSPRHASWQRFVAVRSNAQQAAGMEPILTSSSLAVIDRHYNSLSPYRAHQPTLYAIRYGSGLLLRFVEFDDGHLILRPSAMDCPLQLISIGANKTASDYIVGRVCLLFHEL